MPEEKYGLCLKKKKEKESMPKDMREKNACQQAWEKNNPMLKSMKKREEERKIAHTFK